MFLVLALAACADAPPALGDPGPESTVVEPIPGMARPPRGPLPSPRLDAATGLPTETIAPADDRVALWPDADGDGFGAGEPAQAAPGTDGYAPNAGDCDDEDDTIWPGAPAICGDGHRNDCAGADAPCRYDSPSSVSTAALQLTGYYPDHDRLESAAGVGDLDADGFDDVAFGGWTHSSTGSLEGALYVFGGGRSVASVGLASATATILGTAEAHYVGHRVEGAGDVDGDGYGDLLVTASDRSWVHFGPLTGTRTVESGSVELGPLLWIAVGLGDTDRDGRSELAFRENAPIDPITAGKVHLVSYSGARPALEQERRATWTAATGVGGLGWSLARAGDLSGDGRPDLIMGASNLDERDPAGGAVFVASSIGSGEMSSDDADAMLYGTDWQYASQDLAGAGDVDGDGYGDLAISARTQYPWGTDAEQLVAGWVVLGPFAGEESLVDRAALTVQVASGAEGYQGVAVAGPGDMDGDGFDEVVFGFHGPDTLALFYGPMEGTVLYSDADALIDGPGGYGIGRLGSLDGAGDFDGDGLADLVAAALSSPPTPAGFVLLGGNF